MNKIRFHILNKGIFIIFLSFVFCIGFNLVEAIDGSEITSDLVINLVNLERNNQGKNSLKENDVLNKVARGKLNDMIRNDYFSHVSPEGINSWEWFYKEGYRFEYAGENLATNFSNANEQHQAWMDSPAHRKNILDDRFTEIGVAVGEKIVGEKTIFVTVQVFGTPEKVVISSPNFTPQTFEVPDELFYEGVKVKGQFSQSNFLAAGNLESQGLSENLFVKFSSWFILITITLLIVVMEFKLLISGNRRGN